MEMEEYVNAQRLSEIFGIDIKTARAWGRAAGAEYKIGRIIRYSLPEVKEYLRSGKTTKTGK